MVEIPLMCGMEYHIPYEIRREEKYKKKERKTNIKSRDTICVLIELNPEASIQENLLNFSRVVFHQV